MAQTSNATARSRAADATNASSGNPRLRRLLGRPDLGAMSGLVLVFVFFAIGAHGTGMFAADGILNWSTVSGYLMIIAVGAALLMIGGEFDLSLGSMIGFVRHDDRPADVKFHVPITLSILFAFACALAIGFLNGLIVVRTRLPSFIVTLASLYILRGLTLALSILFTNRTIVGGVKEAADGSFRRAFSSAGTVGNSLFAWLAEHDIIGRLPNGEPSVKGVPMPILWALALAIVGHIVLTKTKVGNWIFASGGDANAARSVGVPVAGVKICAFHADGLLRGSLRDLPGDGIRFGGFRSRPPQGIRGDHRRGDRRLPADRRLWLGRSAPASAP